MRFILRNLTVQKLHKHKSYIRLSVLHCSPTLLHSSNLLTTLIESNAIKLELYSDNKTSY